MVQLCVDGGYLFSLQGGQVGSNVLGHGETPDLLSAENLKKRKKVRKTRVKQSKQAGNSRKLQ